MRHKNILIAGVIAAILGGAAVTAAAIKTQQHSSSPAASVQHVAPHYLTYRGVSGKTALALLQERAQVGIKRSSFGALVDSVNGVHGGGKYWMFYVNGKQAQVGADAYVTKNGEKIEWKFE